MSSKLFTSNNERLHVTSYAGPANTLERTRVRLQFDTTTIHDGDVTTPVDPERGVFASLGYNDVAALHQALDRWLAEYREKEPT